MGVPSFFKWLTKKFPKVVTDVKEEESISVDGHSLPIDTSKPNPNGIEWDCLYLDMNGIIHPCCHPEGQAAPATEEEMIENIFKYVDRIFAMVRPRKLLYMAIDGVAPRAKMNQQRSRRFRAALEVQQKLEAEAKIRAEWEAEGKKLPKAKPAPWDSNVITPGTPFMARLSHALHWYVHDRLTNDPGWKGIKVIFSDAKVPGEGEHKIMAYIRLQRAQPGYDPNLRHCLYGMDADLIMLGLASHEPYFTIVREEVVSQSTRKCNICGQEGHWASDCQGEARVEFDAGQGHKELRPFQFLHINILREYLERELAIPNLPFRYDFERIIDDFIFLCFFVGNDFLPHLPSLEIREGAIDHLMRLYKQLLPSMPGYLSSNGQLDLSRIDVLLTKVGEAEDGVFARRKNREERQSRIQKDRDSKTKAIKQLYKQNLVKAKKQAALNKKRERMGLPPQTEEEIKLNANPSAPYTPAVVAAMDAALNRNKDIPKATDANSNANLMAAQLLRESLKKKGTKRKADDTPASTTSTAPLVPESLSTSTSTNDEDANKTDAANPQAQAQAQEGHGDGDGEVVEEEAKKKLKTDSGEAVESGLVTDLSALDSLDALDDDDEWQEQAARDSYKEELDSWHEESCLALEEDDEIKLGESGWKERYYLVKMGLDKRNPAHKPELDKLFKAYAEGLCWVMQYYYNGCPSWNWYYPFHYAPMASDLINLDRFKIEFELSQPFSPLEQLMGVLPAASSQCMPTKCRELMTDPDSEIIDFYPTKFPLDLNGKKFLWQAVALLPWIDEKRLLSTMKRIEHTFTPEEKDRNSRGVDYLFVRQDCPLANTLTAIYSQEPIDYKTKHELDIKESGGMFGFVMADPKAVTPGDVSHCNIRPREDEPLVVACFSVIYEDPPYRPHESKLLTERPPSVLSEADFYSDSRRQGFQGQAASFQHDRAHWQSNEQGTGWAGQLTYGQQRFDVPDGRGGYGPETGRSGYRGGNGGRNDRGGDQRYGGAGAYPPSRSNSYPSASSSSSYPPQSRAPYGSPPPHHYPPHQQPPPPHHPAPYGRSQPYPQAYPPAPHHAYPPAHHQHPPRGGYPPAPVAAAPPQPFGFAPGGHVYGADPTRGAPRPYGSAAPSSAAPRHVVFGAGGVTPHHSQARPAPAPGRGPAPAKSASGAPIPSYLLGGSALPPRRY